MVLEAGVTKEIRSIADLTPDARNANAGTERGAYMVEHSLEEYGAGRSILVDADGNVIAGNKTLQAAVDLGLEIEVVKTDGRKLVVVQREDLDLLSDDQRARLLAYADNRASETGLQWDADVVALDIAEGLDLGDWFQDFEIAEIIGDSNAVQPPEEFTEYNEDIETEHCCPKCGYRWSGGVNLSAE